MTGAMKRTHEGEEKRTVPLTLHPKLNQQLLDFNVDFIYHMGLSTNDDLKKMFGDVRIVCMHGSPERALHFAQKLAEVLKTDEPVKPIGKTERATMCKVGPVMSISHGMGQPSCLIFLHEVTKMLAYAGCDLDKIDWLRLGSSGGIGVPPGTVVIASEGVDSCLQPGFNAAVCGVMKRWPAVASVAFNKELLACCEQGSGDGKIPAIIAKTIGTDDYYEGQGRLDGALDPGYTEDDKMKFLKKAYDMGVRNMEMECQAFLSFFQRLGTGRAAVACAAFLDRLEGDRTAATTTPEMLKSFTDRTQLMAVRYIRKTVPEACVPHDDA